MFAVWRFIAVIRSLIAEFVRMTQVSSGIKDETNDYFRKVSCFKHLP
jgi:hypothetical protein